MLTYTLTVGSICGATVTVLPFAVPVFLSSFPAALPLSGLRLFEITSAGPDGCASRLAVISAPLKRPVSELELPAALPESGETLFETTSTGLLRGIMSPWATGAVCERASRDRKVMKMESCILEVGNGGLL